MESKKSNKNLGARLHILLSRDSGRAVIIRRGPSKRVCTFSWDRCQDSFSIGQWLRGRIYERRCDLSPDGKYLIYFANNGLWESETKGSWTAVSRAPFLKALCLWPKGDCWNGGGLFISANRYWLNDGYGHELLHDTEEVKRDEEYSPEGVLGNNECPGVYYPRLVRDGWRFMGSREEQNSTHVDLFEKQMTEGWILRKLAKSTIYHPVGKGCYYDEHELVNLENKDCWSYPEWEWAEKDGNRLVWAAGGKLFASRLSKDGLININELYDFNPYKYKRLKAPY